MQRRHKVVAHTMCTLLSSITRRRHWLYKPEDRDMQLHLWLRRWSTISFVVDEAIYGSPLSRCAIPNAFNNRAGSIENRAVITFQYLYFNARPFHSVAMYFPSLRSNRLIEIPTQRAWRKRFSRWNYSARMKLFCRNILFVEFSFGVSSFARNLFLFAKYSSSQQHARVPLQPIICFYSRAILCASNVIHPPGTKRQENNNRIKRM